MPNVRMVLLKTIEDAAFVFYTNYESRKAEEIDGAGKAAFVLHWKSLRRQIRARGAVTKEEGPLADAYYRSRSLPSRLGAWASRQSSVIAGRQVLDERLAELQAQYPDDDIPLPPFWGGFRVTPRLFEFWHGRPNRLHDRLCYTLQPDGIWKIERLAP
jgi:pyridoxamine 5'-phosphate oxidase